MEIKVTIGFDEKATSLLTRLTEALCRPQVSEVDPSNAEPSLPVETEMPKKKSKAAQEKKAEEPKAKDADVETEDNEDITIEDLRLLLATAKRAGHMTEIKNILNDFNVSLLSDLKAEHYGAVAKRVRAL